MNSLEAAVYNYVASKEGIWSRSTTDTACAKLITLSRFDLKDPQNLFDNLSREGYSLYSIQTYLILASDFEKAHFKTGLIKAWLKQNHGRFKGAYKKKIHAITDEQFESFLKAAPNNELYNFLVLMGKAGLRKSEAFSVTWDQIDQGFLHVLHGKGSKQRAVPFKKEWLKGTPIPGETVIPEKLPIKKFFNQFISPFTPHDFRSYYATKVVNIPGLSIEDARQLLGHAEVSTTLLYLRANKEKQAKLIGEAFI